MQLPKDWFVRRTPKIPLFYNTSSWSSSKPPSRQELDDASLLSSVSHDIEPPLPTTTNESSLFHRPVLQAPAPLMEQTSFLDILPSSYTPASPNIPPAPPNTQSIVHRKKKHSCRTMNTKDEKKIETKIERKTTPVVNSRRSSSTRRSSNSSSSKKQVVQQIVTRPVVIPYTKQEKAERIQRFMQKRARRLEQEATGKSFSNVKRYLCRSVYALRRPRGVQGRFVPLLVPDDLPPLLPLLQPPQPPPSPLPQQTLALPFMSSSPPIITHPVPRFRHETERNDEILTRNGHFSPRPILIKKEMRSDSFVSPHVQLSPLARFRDPSSSSSSSSSAATTIPLF